MQHKVASLGFYALLTISAVLVGLMIRAFFFSIYIVEGNSMYPALSQGDLIFVNRISKQYSVGDIVVFFSGDRSSSVLVKRLIANGVSTVFVSDFRVFVDQRAIDVDRLRFTDSVTLAQFTRKYHLKPDVENLEDSKLLFSIEPTNTDRKYLVYWDRQAFECRFSEVSHVKPNEVYVLGDNRCESFDSRNFGPLAADKIIGKVIGALKFR